MRGSTRVLGGTVNPNSVDNVFAPTAWRLQVLRDGVDWQTVSSGSVGAGTAPVTVTGTVTALNPNTAYMVRVVT
jgi:hypothetical protein